MRMERVSVPELVDASATVQHVAGQWEPNGAQVNANLMSVRVLD
jgi:hypothetical protein